MFPVIVVAYVATSLVNKDGIWSLYQMGYIGVYFESATKFKCSFSEKKQSGIFKSFLIAYLGKLAGAHQKRCCSS